MFLINTKLIVDGKGNKNIFIKKYFYKKKSTFRFL